MKFFYENQNSSSFLVYKIEEEDKLDSFIYGMVANNKINGVIPGNITQINSEKFLKYNVSSTVTLSQYFEGIVNKNRILNVFLSIVGAFIESEDFMLDSSMFVLDKDYIFVDVSSAKASIICFPMVGYSADVKPIDFFKNIIFSIQYDRTENSDYVAEIITFLNSSESFSLVKFKEMLQKLNSAKTQSVQKPRPQAAAPVKSAPQPKAVPPVKPEAPAKPVAPVPTPPVSNPAPKPASAKADFEIPGGKPAPAKPAETPAADTGEKISLMHLLRDFSKENLELYKAQKNSAAADVRKAPAVPEASAKKDKKNKKDSIKAPKDKSSAGFAIPGQNNNVIPPRASEPAPVAKPAPAPAAKPAPKPGAGLGVLT